MIYQNAYVIVAATPLVSPDMIACDLSEYTQTDGVDCSHGDGIGTAWTGERGSSTDEIDLYREENISAKLLPLPSRLSASVIIHY